MTDMRQRIIEACNELEPKAFFTITLELYDELFPRPTMEGELALAYGNHRPSTPQSVVAERFFTNLNCTPMFNPGRMMYTIHKRQDPNEETIPR